MNWEITLIFDDYENAISNVASETFATTEKEVDILFGYIRMLFLSEWLAVVTLDTNSKRFEIRFSRKEEYLSYCQFIRNISAGASKG